MRVARLSRRIRDLASVTLLGLVISASPSLTTVATADDVNGVCPFTQTRTLCNSSGGGPGGIDCPALTAGFPGEGANQDSNDNFDLTNVVPGSIISVKFTNLTSATANVSLQNNGGDAAPLFPPPPPGGSLTTSLVGIGTMATATHTVVAGEPPSYQFTANVDQQQAVSYVITCTEPIATLTLDKTANVTSVDAAGDIINYSFLVTNTGTATLTNITVTDPLPGLSAISCPTTTLLPGASTTCTASLTVTQPQIDAGTAIVNTATADSTESGPDTDDATVTITQTPALTIDKTATPTTYSAVGNVISYSYLVTNSGNVTLSGPFTVSDDKSTDEACPPTASLAPAASITCTASYTITQADLDTGSVTNVASASNGTVTSPTDTETVTVVANPAWTLVKTATPTTYNGSGEAISYSYVVTNTGNVTINAISVNDDVSGPTTCPATTLAPGAAMTCTDTYTTTVGDVGAGSITNTGTAAGTPSSGILANATDTETVTFVRLTGSLSVTKVVLGGNGTFTFTLTNQPAFTLTNGQTKAFASLAAGSYTLAESNLPAGWVLDGVSCSETVTRVGNSVIIQVDPKDAITCTFTNAKEFDDEMGAVSQLFVHRRVDNLLTYGPDRARLLRRLQAGDQQGTSIEPLKFASASQSSMMLGRTIGGGTSKGVNPIGVGGDATLFGEDLFAYGAPGHHGPLESDADLAMNEQTSGTGTILSHIASKIAPLATGENAFKFGTSLSELRAVAAEAAANQEKKKLAAAGLSYENHAYNNPLATMRQGFDFFVEGHVGRYDDDTAGFDREGDFRVLYVGVDYSLTPDVLIGALAQIDDTREDVSRRDAGDLKGEIEGTGWMFGPFVGIRLSENLYFDARAAYGTSDNEVWLSDTITGKRSGDFDTDRWLATATLTGAQYYGDWRLSPQIGLAYGREWYDDYRNSIGQRVEGSDISIGRLTGAIEVGYKWQDADGTTFEPHASLTGIWNFATDDLEIDGASINMDETRAKVEAGILITTPQGWGLRAAGAYDGIGSNDLEAYSGSLWVNIPLD